MIIVIKMGQLRREVGNFSDPLYITDRLIVNLILPLAGAACYHFASCPCSFQYCL